MSSEAPVERFDWWTGERYYEVLDHGPNGVDLGYARDGLPFLLDHQQRVQVGLLEDVTLDKDRKLRATITMGHHPEAGWVEKDIRAGIRKKVSIGYDPGETYHQTQAKGDAIPTRTYTGWRLYEGSSVAIPADYDVGVARAAFEERRGQSPSLESSRKAKESTMPEGAQVDGAAPAPAGGAVGVGRDYDAERKARNAANANILAMAHPDVRAEVTQQCLREDWAVEVTARQVAEANARKAAEPVPAGRIDMSEKEQKKYSLSRAILSLLPGERVDAGFEREVSQEIARRTGTQPKGLFFPLSLKADMQRAAQVRAAVTGNVATTTSLGGAGVETQVAELIEILRARAVLPSMGATFLTGLTGNVQMPRVITANSWTWEGENPATAKALSAATFDSFTASPKTGMGATAFSKQFLRQSSFDVEQFVRDDLAAIAALGIDVAGINGSGASNQPTGILNLSGVETIVMGTNGGPLTWTTAVTYEEKQAINNADQGVSLAFLTTPAVRRYLKTTLKNTVNGAQYIWGENDTLNGYKAVVSNQMPANLTKGTSTTVCSGVVFGNWRELLMFVWGDTLDLTVDPYFYADQGMVRVIEMAMVDVNARHPKSFVVTKDATT